MTVKQLKKALETVNENLEVFIKQTNDDFANSLSETAEVKTLTMYDGEGGEEMMDLETFVISDEI